MSKNRLSDKLRMPSHPDTLKNRSERLVPIALSLGTAAAAVVFMGPRAVHGIETGISHLNNGIDAIGERIYEPSFSEETGVIQASYGDTVWDDVVPLVDDPHNNASTGEIKTYVMKMPANHDTFENGQLDAGEFVYYPLRVQE